MGRAENSVSGAASGRAATSERNRRQARAPSRPAMTPCMCRVIECRRMPRCAQSFGVRHHALDDLPGLRDRPLRIDQALLEFGEQRRPMIGRSAEHHAVDAFDAGVRRSSAPSHRPAVQYHGQVGRIALQAMHEIVLERRNLAILLGRQAAEDGDARMHDERIDARGARPRRRKRGKTHSRRDHRCRFGTSP